MFKIIVERECGCFKRSDFTAYTEVETKDEALLKSIEMKETMNNEFCEKHNFEVQEEGDTFKIVMV